MLDVPGTLQPTERGYLRLGELLVPPHHAARYLNESSHEIDAQIDRGGPTHARRRPTGSAVSPYLELCSLLGERSA